MTVKWSKLGFLIKMMKILLESSHKRPLLKMDRRNPYENGLGWIIRQFWYRRSNNLNMITCQEPLRGMLTLMFKKFGALAIAVGILGAPYFRNFGSPKIRKNGSAPRILCKKDCLKDSEFLFCYGSSFSDIVFWSFWPIFFSSI